MENAIHDKREAQRKSKIFGTWYWIWISTKKVVKKSEVKRLFQPTKRSLSAVTALAIAERAAKNQEHKNGGFSNDDKLAKQEGDPADFELIHRQKAQIHWTG